MRQKRLSTRIASSKSTLFIVSRVVSEGSSRPAIDLEIENEYYGRTWYRHGCIANRTWIIHEKVIERVKNEKTATKNLHKF